jgi:hypothetical protein
MNQNGNWRVRTVLIGGTIGALLGIAAGLRPSDQAGSCCSRCRAPGITVGQLELVISGAG